jgi:hypothetical protein
MTTTSTRLALKMSHTNWTHLLLHPSITTNLVKKPSTIPRPMHKSVVRRASNWSSRCNLAIVHLVSHYHVSPLRDPHHRIITTFLKSTLTMPDEEAIAAALADLGNQDPPNLMATAKKYKVDRMTLKRRFYGLSESRSTAHINIQGRLTVI